MEEIIDAEYEGVKIREQHIFVFAKAIQSMYWENNLRFSQFDVFLALSRNALSPKRVDPTLLALVISEEYDGAVIHLFKNCLSREGEFIAERLLDILTLVRSHEPANDVSAVVQLVDPYRLRR